MSMWVLSLLLLINDFTFYSPTNGDLLNIHSVTHPRAALHNHYLQQLAKNQLLKIIYLFSSEQGLALLSFATGSGLLAAGLLLFGPCIFSLLYSPRAGSRVK